MGRSLVCLWCNLRPVGIDRSIWAPGPPLDEYSPNLLTDSPKPRPDVQGPRTRRAGDARRGNRTSVLDVPAAVDGWRGELRAWAGPW
ncbi:MAG: hypothetical protein M9936_24850 [Caldilinea sp.]|nr:hypothetical protein [Caldilineaceae bacterium]MCB9121997.1 hypothetical protein [Caldilineaceae bacterium]MCO5212942.1 hypothetical protein [Caldilinea sp.]MCW5840409.1 hypothetical protein [Caldilinea sp.]